MSAHACRWWLRVPGEPTRCADCGRLLSDVFADAVQIEVARLQSGRDGALIKWRRP